MIGQVTFKQIKTIENQGKKQIKAIDKHGKKLVKSNTFVEKIPPEKCTLREY